MSVVKFISTQYLKDNSALENNVDDNLLNTYIIKAQDMYIQQAFGSGFYSHIKSAIIGSTLTAAEESLLRDYVQPCLTEWTVYEILPFVNYKMTNKAVSVQNSEYSNPSGLAEIKYLRASVKDVAEFLLKRLNNYLCDNENLFPEYASQTDKNLVKSKKSYFSGIYLGKTVPGSDIESYDEPYDCR